MYLNDAHQIKDSADGRMKATYSHRCFVKVTIVTYTSFVLNYRPIVLPKWHYMLHKFFYMLY